MCGHEGKSVLSFDAAVVDLSGPISTTTMSIQQLTFPTTETLIFRETYIATYAK